MDLYFDGLFLMLVALTLWVLCLLVFVASTNQKFIDIPPNKYANWFAFCILTVFSCLLFNQVYPLVISIILLFALFITMWLMMIFLHAYLGITLLPSSILGIANKGTLLSLGGLHVF